MKKTTPSHIVNKLHSVSDKQTILKATRVKQTYVTHRGTKVKVTLDFLSEISRATSFNKFKGKLLGFFNPTKVTFKSKSYKDFFRNTK